MARVPRGYPGSSQGSATVGPAVCATIREDSLAPPPGRVSERPICSQDPVVVALRLARVRAAPCAARRAGADGLRDVVDAATLDDVLLVVSELVTNAVLHGAGTIDLELRFDGACVTGNVADEGGGFAPVLPVRPSGGAGGNGLFLVDRVAGDWGIEAGTSRVWFAVPDRAAAAS